MPDGRLADEAAHALLARRLREYSQGAPIHRSWANGHVRQLLVTVPLAVPGGWNGALAALWASRSHEPRSSSGNDIIWLALLDDRSLVQEAIEQSFAHQIFVDPIEQALFQVGLEMARIDGGAYRLPVASDAPTRSMFVSLVLPSTN